MTGIARVVFACNIFVQSLLSASGPAARCLQSAERGHLRLFVSEYVLEEVRDVALRPKIVSRFGITLTGLEAFLAHILAISECLEDVPAEFHYDRDRDDAHDVNLAIAAHASLIHCKP